MANYKAVNADQLDADITTVANAIRAKAGTSGKMAFPNGMADAVRNIKSGGTELPELSNPGTASDLAQGKQFIDENGNAVTGTVEDGASWIYQRDDEVDAFYDYEDEGNLCFHHTFEKDVLYRKGGHITLAYHDIGDAQPGDVVAGKTFTSAAGVSIQGNVKEVSTVYTTPPGKATMEWDDDWKASNVLEEDVLLRKGTSVDIWFGQHFFGDASTVDVAKGITFTSGSGIKIEGTMEPGFKNLYHYHGDVVAYPEDGALCFEHTFEKDCFYRNGERICLNHSDLGDALPQEVVKGRTFTTSKGVKIEGTMEPGSGGVQMHVDGETLVITGAVAVEKDTLIL